MARSGLPVWLMAALLVLVTMAIYWPVMRHDFVNYDDTVYVTANAHVQDGLTLENMKCACFNPVGGIWHPLTVWSHMADWRVWPGVKGIAHQRQVGTRQSRNATMLPRGSYGQVTIPS
jgi:hypothetical protein